MTNQVDNLEIDFKVKGLSKSSISNINALADALKEINKVVTDFSGLENYANAINKISNAVKVMQSTAVNKTLSNQVPKEYTDTGTAQSGGSLAQIQGVDNAVNEAQSSVGKFASWFDKTSQQVSGNFNSMTHSAEESAKVFMEFGKTDLEKKLDEVDKKQKQLSKSTKKTTNGWNKFIESLGRIALYRTIRRTLQIIVQTMQEGLQNYAQYSSETNNALSNIKNSAGQLTNTLGVTLGSALESLAPIFEELIGYVTVFFEKINMAIASMQGKSTYTRAIRQNKDYADSLQKVNEQLTSFDKFETLSKDNGTDVSTMFEEVALPEQIDDTTSMFVDLFGVLKDIVDLIISLKPIIVAMLEFIEKDLKQNIIPSLKYFIDMIQGLINMLTGNFGNGISGFGKGLGNLLLKRLKWIIDPFGLYVNKANGGMVDTGTAFIAGEAGAEVVATSSSGTGVTNIEQFTQAMYNALTMYGASRGEFGGDVVLNGSRVGQLVTKAVYDEGTRVGYFKRV